MVQESRLLESRVRGKATLYESMTSNFVEPMETFSLASTSGDHVSCTTEPNRKFTDFPCYRSRTLRRDEGDEGTDMDASPGRGHPCNQSGPVPSID